MASRTRAKRSSFPNRILNELRYWFEIDEAFAHLPKQNRFRIAGSLLNVLSAIAIGIVLRSWPLALLCFLSLPAFLLCMRMVRIGLANTLCLLLSAYWSIIGWTFGTRIAPFLGIGWGAALILTGSFFLGSLILHIRYIHNRTL